MLRTRGPVGRDARTAGGRSLPKLFRDRCIENPDAACMREKRYGIWRAYTWREVQQRVRYLSRGLAALGVGKGCTVAIASENIVELYWAEYAALSAGARVVCMYPDMIAPEMLYVLEHSGARVLFAEDQEQVDKALSIAKEAGRLERVVYIDDRGLWHYEHPLLMDFRSLLDEGRAADEAAPGKFDLAVDEVDRDDVAVICYTSGTTGSPKGVMLTHRYLLDNAYRLMAAFGIRPGADYLSYISPAWAAEQITGLALGLLCPMVVNFPEKPETVRRDLRELGPEFLLFTPRQWEMMASEVQASMIDADRVRRTLYEWAVNVGRASAKPGAGFVTKSVLRWLADLLVLRGIRDNLGLKRARVALSGGSGLSASIFTLYHAFGVALRNLYGSTELGLIAAHWQGGIGPDTMGQLLPTDPTIGEPLEVWVDEGGELVVGGGCHFAGYHRDAEATAAVLAPGGGYRTGDAVRLNDGGELIFLDRLKDLRRLADGYAFPPQFIENHLRASPIIKDAIVLGDEQKPFVAALINIDAEIVGRYAEHRGLAFGTFAELSQLPEVRREVGRAIAVVNRLLDEKSRIRRFATLPKELDPDEAEMTRSRKLRRAQIESRYRDIISAIYGGADRCTATIAVQYRDGQRGEVSAVVAVDEVEA